MEIQSAFNSGVQGFQKATEMANQAAVDIVAETTAARDSSISEVNGQNTATFSSEPFNNANKVPELNQSIVELKVAEYQAKSATEVIKTADESLGTLLDVTA
jgi:hypothetical protein